ncbi:uncharacterized protein CTRU02_205120 [Colletotrichum truncatum]|uniref:Uncharacterized protein n=1 Tax=Colletotrichum truncatum TaxID=5467 RepID=A0ACC3Z347_COLTU
MVICLYIALPGCQVKRSPSHLPTCHTFALIGRKCRIGRLIEAFQSVTACYSIQRIFSFGGMLFEDLFLRIHT